MIVCVTAFDRPLMETLNRHRVEYLFRPFKTEDLRYLITHRSRTMPINPAENLRRILAAAGSLGYPVRCRICAFQQDRPVVVEAADVAAFRSDRNRSRLWTKNGIFDSSQPVTDIAEAVDLSTFKKVYRNAWISTDQQRFGGSLKRARRWLRWSELRELIMKGLLRHVSHNPDHSNSRP
jgi:DNA-binding LytR/AlgR family response regulator